MLNLNHRMRLIATFIWLITLSVLLSGCLGMKDKFAQAPLADLPSKRKINDGPEGPQLCTSQWGYDYLCNARAPILQLASTEKKPIKSLALPQTFVDQQVQASFIIWNGGGGKLTGTVTVPAPFSIVSGGSFSLLPGEPQEVVVRFSSTNPGSFSRSISISSNGGNKTISVIGTTWEYHFLGELQREDGNTLRLGMLDSTDVFRTGFFFNPFSAQPLYFWHQFDQLRQEALITIQFREERLQGG